MRALVVLMVLGGIARADRMPSGRMSAVIGLDHKSGFGIAGGAEASWEPFPDGRKLGYTLAWDVLFSSYGQDPAAINGSLHLVEMHLGARGRIALGTTTRSLWIGGGAALLRASSPLAPRDRRDYVGGFGSVGLEWLVKGALVTLDLRYGVIASAPRSFAGLVGVGFGF